MEADIKLTREWHFRITAGAGMWPDMLTHAGAKWLLRADMLSVTVIAADGEAPAARAWTALGAAVGTAGTDLGFRDKSHHFFGHDDIPEWLTSLLRQCVAAAVADLPGFVPPLAKVIAYIKASGWEKISEGSGGAAWLWPGGSVEACDWVGFPHDDPGDGDSGVWNKRFLRGAIERIADREKRAPHEVIADILAAEVMSDA